MLDKHVLRPLSYGDFGQILDRLTEAVTVRLTGEPPIDLVVPILRSGAVTAVHLASKLAITSFLPVQYKYDTNGAVQRLLVPSPGNHAPHPARILLVDTNTVTGRIAAMAASDLRACFPSARIDLATAVADHALPAIAHVTSIMRGAISNESRSLSAEEAEALNVTNEVWVFPWEDVDEQWGEIQKST